MAVDLIVIAPTRFWQCPFDDVAHVSRSPSAACLAAITLFAKAKRPHYNILELKRNLAVPSGAIEVDAMRLIEICRDILANDAPWRADPEYLAQKAAQA
jgi:hypothetical protein